MENILKFFIAVTGAAVSYLFGGWSTLLSMLLTFVVIDYVSGVLAAYKEKKISSSIGFIGIARKMGIFAIVAMGHLIDRELGDGHVFRDAAIFFYLSNETISIIENAGRLGVKIPPGFKQAAEVFKSKGVR